MRQEYIELIKTLAPVVSAIIAAWLTARFTLRNAFQTFQLQNEHRMKELISEREYKEKENLRVWFEDYAVNKSIDPLSAEILFIQNLFVQIAAKGKTKIEPNIEMPPIPFDACVRLFNLTGTMMFPFLLHMSRQALSYNIDEAKCQKYTQFLNGILIGLLRLKQIFLTLELNRKSDLYKVCSNTMVQKGGEFLDKSITDMFGLEDITAGKRTTAEILRAMGQQTLDLSQLEFEKKSRPNMSRS